jgi:hypothetical protein
MGLSTGDLAQIETLLGATGAGAQAVAELRRRFPRLSLTRCDPSDLGVELPFRAFRVFDLYLVDGTDHCWRLTSDPERATGVVLVTRKEDA